MSNLFLITLICSIVAATTAVEEQPPIEYVAIWYDSHFEVVPCVDQDQNHLNACGAYILDEKPTVKAFQTKKELGEWLKQNAGRFNNDIGWMDAKLVGIWRLGEKVSFHYRAIEKSEPYHVEERKWTEWKPMLDPPDGGKE